MKIKKRWTRYQADNPKRGYNTTVDFLTEAQAKDELCDAMDLIEKMMDAGYEILHHAREAHYATK